MSILRSVGWLLAPMFLPACLLGLWEMCGRFGIVPTTLIASPSDVLRALVRLGVHGSLFHHACVSLQRLSIGLCIGGLLAVFSGSIIGTSRVASRLMSPTISFLAPVPVSAWIPLVIILVGIGEPAKYSLVGIGAFFVVFYATVHGIRSTDVKLVEVGRVLVYCLINNYL